MWRSAGERGGAADVESVREEASCRRRKHVLLGKLFSDLASADIMSGASDMSSLTPSVSLRHKDRVSAIQVSLKTNNSDEVCAPGAPPSVLASF